MLANTNSKASCIRIKGDIKHITLNFSLPVVAAIFPTGTGTLMKAGGGGCEERHPINDADSYVKFISVTSLFSASLKRSLSLSISA